MRNPRSVPVLINGVSLSLDGNAHGGGQFRHKSTNSPGRIRTVVAGFKVLHD